jgi:hypothetical protein
VDLGGTRALLNAYIPIVLSLDPRSEHNKAKRQEALTDTLRGMHTFWYLRCDLCSCIKFVWSEHFSSLSVSIKQDLLDAVVPVIDNLATTVTLLQKGPDNNYK